MDGHCKFPGGGGSQKPKFIKESMTLNLNFRRGGGGGSNLKSIGGGGMDISWKHNT